MDDILGLTGVRVTPTEPVGCFASSWIGSEIGGERGEILACLATEAVIAEAAGNHGAIAEPGRHDRKIGRRAARVACPPAAGPRAALPNRR